MGDRIDRLIDLPELDALIDRAVLQLSPELTVSAAIELVLAADSNSVAVVDGERWVGILTVRELLGWTRSGRDLTAISVGEIASTPATILTLSPDTTTVCAIELLSSQQLELLPIVDTEGKFIGILNAHQLLASCNLTAILSELEHLRDRERRFRTIFDSSFQCCGLLSLDGIVLEANRTALTFIPNRADLVGKHFWEAPWWQTLPAVRERVRESVATAARGEAVRWECEYLRGDGVLAWADFTIAPFVDEDGKVVMLIPEGRDITERQAALRERQQAQRALEESEEQFRIMATHAPVGIFQADSEGNCTFINHKCLELTGLSFAQALGQGWQSSIHPEDRSIVFRAWGKLIAGERDFVLEFRLQTPQGRTNWVAGNALALRGREGKITGFFGTLTDISERQRVQEDLQRSTAALRNAVEGISYIDPHGCYQMVNHAYAETVGYQPAEMVGMSWQKTVHPDDLDKMLVAYDRMLAVGKVELEARGIKRDGALFYKQLTMVTDRDRQGQIIGHYCFMKDITDRKAAELALQHAQQRIITTWETMSDAYIALDRDFCYTYANQAAIEVFVNYTGCDSTAIIGQTPWQLFPDLVGTAAERYFRQAMDEQIPIHFEMPYREDEWFEIHVYPSAIGLSIYFREISDRKLAEAELERQRQELTRSNQELAQFAYVASHDLQEPLRMITSYLELLSRQYQGQLDDRADKFIGYAVDGAKRMQALIQDLLSYSRLGTQSKPWVAVDCATVAADALKNLRLAIAESGAIITIADLPQVTGDAIQLTQVFQNLIANAIKFRRPDNPPQIIISSAKVNTEWLFYIQDNGIGIDNKYLDRIFVIFQRLHGRADYSGTGIGLAVCKKIIERHGGKIWVESALDRGSTFYFTIPDRSGGDE